MSWAANLPCNEGVYLDQPVIHIVEKVYFKTNHAIAPATAVPALPK